MKSADQPLVSYDYWAPISESGEWRESLFRARPFNLFLQNYANVLALAESCPPLHPVTDSEDRVRAQARMHGKQGFVFVSNYGNVHPLSDRKEFRLSLDIDGRAIQIPHTMRVGLPSGTTRIWPVNLDLGAGVNLISSTSQPMCRFMVDDVFWHVFGQLRTVAAEFVLATRTVSHVYPGKRGKLLASTALAKVVQLDPSRETVLEAIAVDGRKVHILLLSLEDAGRLSQLGNLLRSSARLELGHVDPLRQLCLHRLQNYSASRGLDLSPHACAFSMPRFCGHQRSGRRVSPFALPRMKCHLRCTSFAGSCVGAARRKGLRRSGRHLP